MCPRQLLCALPLLALACASHAPQPAFIVPGAADDDLVARALAAAPLAPDQKFRVDPMLTSEQTSISVAQIRDREPPHIHTRYDLTVLLAKGHGTLWLAGVARPMRAGDVAYIPRGTPHWFVNDGDAPAVSVVVYAPPFSGPDQAPVP